MKRNKYLEKLKHYWKPEDKAWLKQRKQEWKRVKHNLTLFTKGNKHFETRYHKHHEELFLYGTISPNTWQSIYKKSVSDPSRTPATFDSYSQPLKKLFIGTGQLEFLGVLPLFILWYLPKIDKEIIPDLKNMFLDYTMPDEAKRLKGWQLMSTRSALFEQFNSVFLSMGHNYALDPSYGLMNGREELATELLCPGYDYQTTYQVLMAGHENLYDAVTYPPAVIFGKCFGASVKELCGDARYYPNSPGIFLWDHLSFVFGNYPDQLTDTLTAYRFVFPNLLARFFIFHDRADPSRYRPTTIKFVENILKKYESKTFSPLLLKQFDAAKKNIKKLTIVKENEEIFTMSEKYLLKVSKLSVPKRKPFSVKEQRAIRTLWDQVDIITEI